MCATKKKKCLFLSLRFVSSRLRLFRPFGCACFPFLLYSKFRFAFFSPKGLRVFIVFRTTDWLQYEKTKKPEHKFRWPLCVCAPNLVFFLVAAAFMIIEPSHTLTHTHTLSPSVQHLSLSQNSRCISESHLKFCFFLLCVFLFLFFLIFAWANYAFCVSYFEYLSFVSVVSFGRNNWGKTRQAEGGGEREREDKSAFLSL